MSNPTTTPLPPGFRFHPTDEELILHYLRRRASSTVSPVPLIADVDIYKFNPWDLPCKAMFGEKEWYFFSPRDRKYPNGVRPNRAAASGYWKATGTDKPIHATSETTGDDDQYHQIIGVKKALVFYKGKPPKGLKTNWIMHEYRLISQAPQTTPIYTFKPPLPFKDSTSMRLDDWVLCRIYKKNNHHMSPERDQQEESLTSTTVNHHGLHKSSSLSELLNQLFDNPSEIFGFLEDDQLLTNSCGNNSTGVTYKHGASVSENPQKRLLEDGGGFQQPNFKKLNSSCFTNHQNGLMISTQPFLNQKIVLNSQLGLH
ncbi:hypothetical protein J5N97_013610 [Dioscorea zingiberensis]|uniref:NAC domain-containing protein n=1 Tax=Dioscorea zingiberensis TaxID=325984 RepID=A0A9D5HIS9_9LILI|nr:hypothetical protein J5N97_013610 [Dioscorea zingiberensis]